MTTPSSNRTERNQEITDERSLLKFLIEAVRQKKLPPKNKVSKSKDHNMMLRNFDSLKLIRGILNREVTI